MSMTSDTCPRCGGVMPRYALRCPTCGLTRRVSGYGLRQALPRGERGRDSPPGPPSASRWRRLLESAANLGQEHPLACGLGLGVTILLLVFLGFSLPRLFADPLRRTERVLTEEAVRQQAALAQVQQAEKALGRQEVAQAHTALRRAAELGADSVRLRFLRGQSALELKSYREAVQDLSLASSRGSPCPSAWVLRARALEALGHDRAALVDLRQAAQALPSTSALVPEVYAAMARLHQRLGDLPQALAALEGALAAGRRDAETYLFRGQLREQAGQLEAAVEDYSQAVRLAPQLGRAYLQRGLLMARLQRPEAAVSDLSRALELGVTTAEAYFHRGVAYGQLGQMEAARRDLETAVRLGAFEARPALKTLAAQEQAQRRLTAANPHWDSASPRRPYPKHSSSRRSRRR